MDAATAWEECRIRIVALATSPGAADVHVPACPEWDVKGVVSHLTGIAAAMTGAAASVSDVNTNEATADQVELRADRDVAEIVAEWAGYAPGYVSQLADPAAFGLHNMSVLLSVFDIASHEHDIRYALGKPGHRDEFGVELGAKVMVGGLKGKQVAHDLPPLKLVVPGWRTWDLGGADPALTLTVDRFTLFRALAGRRTRTQVEGLDWAGGDPTPWLEHWLAGVFSWPAEQHED